MNEEPHKIYDILDQIDLVVNDGASSGESRMFTFGHQPSNMLYYKSNITSYRLNRNSRKVSKDVFFEI